MLLFLERDAEDYLNKKPSFILQIFSFWFLIFILGVVLLIMSTYTEIVLNQLPLGLAMVSTYVFIKTLSRFDVFKPIRKIVEKDNHYMRLYNRLLTVIHYELVIIVLVGSAKLVQYLIGLYQ